MARKLKIGVLWCTVFKRRHWYRNLDLPDAYRPASLFASRMREDGHEIEFLLCDELLKLSDLDGTKRTLADDVDLLYIVSHGELNSSQAPRVNFEALLKDVNWEPGGNKGIGNGSLTAVVFDTCHLINTSKKSGSKVVWGAASLGPNLRLLLGFDGPAAIDHELAERGYAFADNLIGGKTFATAWLQAVNSTNPPDYSRPVAIGIEDPAYTGQSVLDTASLSQIPSPRSPGTPIFTERFLP